MASSAYSKEQLNYFRICHVVTNILPHGLRSIFKREWDSRYQATLGEWKDKPQNGLDFYNGESPRSRTRNARLLETIRNENRAKWDCTTLFFAILYSDSIGHGLGAAVRSNVDDLRKFRNEEFAHMPQGQLSDLQFRLTVRKVEIAFQSLGLSTTEIQNIYKQKIFPTKEFQNVLKNVQSLHQELRVTNVKLQSSEEERQLLVEEHQELQQKYQLLDEQHEIREEQHRILEEQFNRHVSSFCILPPKPSHEIAPRESQVERIAKTLELLRKANENGLSYLYISGNPGSGKSQLAGLVAQKFHAEASQDPNTSTFVMTLNAEGSKTLLESYASLARHIKCPEYTVLHTINSTDMQVEEKINSLMDLIATKIPLYGSWLLVVDNVSSLCDVHDFLPRSGNRQWSKGQLLITTQNTSSIPSESSFVSHISVSEGMVPTDACCFLAKVSGIRQQGMEDEVAKILDYQPLALASAGVYVKKIRESRVNRNFGWKEYLEKLERGMKALTEKELTITNPSYKKSMTVATKLAIERAINNDTVVKSAFTLLSLCSQKPLHLDIVINYILNEKNAQLDKEEIALQIQGYSLLMFEERENGIFVSTHQVVHEANKSVIKESRELDELVQVIALVMSFKQFVDAHLPQTWRDRNFNRDSEHFVPHLITFAAEVENAFLHRDDCQVIKEDVFNYFELIRAFRRLAKIGLNHREYSTAKVYCEAALKLAEKDQLKENCERALDKEHLDCALNIQFKKLSPEHLDVASTYHDLGMIESKLCNLEQAKEYHEKALDIRRKNLAPEHVDMANSYHHLANVQLLLHNVEQAKELYERALDIQLKNLEPDHIYLAFSYSGLGEIHRKLGDLEQAKESFGRAFNIRLKKLGSEHVAVASIYHQLGRIESELCNLEQAKEYHEKALDIRRKNLAPEHVDMANSYHHLANVQLLLHNVEQAKELYERALDIQLKNLEPDHIYLAFSYTSLGDVHRELGDLEQAKEYFERALNIRMKKFGLKHVDVKRNQDRLCEVQLSLDNLQHVKERQERARKDYCAIS